MSENIFEGKVYTFFFGNRIVTAVDTWSFLECFIDAKSYALRNGGKWNPYIHLPSKLFRHFQQQCGDVVILAITAKGDHVTCIRRDAMAFWAASDVARIGMRMG